MGWTLAILCSAIFCQREIKSRSKFYFKDGTKYFLFILQFCQTNLKSYHILCSGTFCQREVKSRSILKFHFKDGKRYPLLRTFIKEHKVGTNLKVIRTHKETQQRYHEILCSRSFCQLRMKSR